MKTKRRGFQHWLGTYKFPQPIPESEMGDLLRRLREGDPRAEAQIILSHVRLGMSIVAGYAAFAYKTTDDLVSVMFFALVHGVNLIKHGAMESHENVGGYLTKTIRGQISRFLRNRQVFSVEPILDVEDHRTPVSEVLEELRASVSSDLEGKILDLRIKGYTDAEVGLRLGLSKSRVNQLRERIRVKYDIRRMEGRVPASHQQSPSRG